MNQISKQACEEFADTLKKLRKLDRPAEEPKCDRPVSEGVYDNCENCGIRFYYHELKGCDNYRPPTTEPESEGKCLRCGETVSSHSENGFCYPTSRAVTYPTAPPADSVEDRAWEALAEFRTTKKHWHDGYSVDFAASFAQAEIDRFIAEVGEYLEEKYNWGLYPPSVFHEAMQMVREKMKWTA